MSDWWKDYRKGLIVAGSVAVGLLVVGYVLPPLLSDDADSTAGAVVLWAVLALGYILPTIIASRRNHHNLGAIIAVNVLLGWTFIGWVIALVWSLTDPSPTVRIQQVQSGQVQYQVGDVVNGYRFNGQDWQPLNRGDTDTSAK